MAECHPSIRQRSLLLAVVAAALTFLSGCHLPVARSASPRSHLQKMTPIQEPKPDSYQLEDKPLVAQTNQAYKKVIARLAWREKLRRLNKPVPVQFQGKTFKQVKLNSNYKIVAHAASAKPTVQNTRVKPIALTFDDGPWPNTTAQILNLLKKNNTKATFFVVGRQVQRYPQLVKRIVADGHTLANHTWSHQYRQYNAVAAAREINTTTELIYKLTGVKTTLFRPPGGKLNNGLVAYAQQKKYGVVMWSADSQDWHHPNSKILVDRVLKQASPGGIILLHDGGGDRSKTVQALPKLIAQLKKRGYTFVTVPELLEIQNQQQELIARKG